MVHALTEAHRVLKPNGILIDLRPAPKHRRAGLGEGAGVTWVGWMREDFADDRAASRSVAHVLHQGLYERVSRVTFDLDRVLDSLSDFRAWLDDYTWGDALPSHEWLYGRLERAQQKAGIPRKITIRGPLMLAVLRRI
jgi:SAM-dependent methyltransferase